MKARYDATLTFSRAASKVDTAGVARRDDDFQLGASRVSSTGLRWELVASQDYIEARLISIQRPLALSLIGLVIFSGFTILLLIRRYITGPIAQLDQNLENVIEGRETTIRADESAQDEIAHIARMFRKLYGELSLAYANSKAMAETDQLTALHNLTYLNHHGQALMDAAQAQGLSLGLMYVDLDNFKFVNDRFGHDTGDELLVSLASSFLALLDRYRGQTPLAPILFRIAGDEFGIMVAQNAASPDACHELATEIVALFKTGYRLDKTLLPISASIGIAECPADATQLTHLMSCADSAMYQAQLVEYPVDVVKLDRLFITRMMDTGKSSMLPPLIDLCHLQHIEVTAEGVENEAQLRMLVDSGCDSLQGYYFGQPVPLSRLQAASEQWRIKAAGARRTSLPGKGVRRL